MPSGQWSAPPDVATSRAFWRLLNAALSRAEDLPESALALDEACVHYASSLAPKAKEMIRIKAREP